MKNDNIIAVNVNRPVVTGQVRPNRYNGFDPHVEAAVTAIVKVMFGINLLPPMSPSKMWRPRPRADITVRSRE